MCEKPLQKLVMLPPALKRTHNHRGEHSTGDVKGQGRILHVKSLSRDGEGGGTNEN